MDTRTHKQFTTKL